VVVAVATLAAAGCGSSRTKTASTGATGRTGASTVSIASGGRVVLVYRAYAGAEPVTPTSLDAAIRIMRKRLAEANVSSDIERSGPRDITVILPGVVTAPSAEPIVGKTAQLLFYDWEPNVIGADGKPAPSEATVTGGPNAGASQFGLPEYQAVLRAAKRAPELRKTDTTWGKGCTPAQAGGCIYGDWYLLEAKHEKILRGPEETEKNLFSDYKVPAGATVKAVRVNPGTVLMEARPIESASGKVTQKSPNSWFVLLDRPVLTGADVKNPRQGFDEGAGGTGAPNVTFEFTGHGQNVFQQTTKEIAHRGQEAQLPGVPKEAAQQHFAVVLDGQLITTPSIDYTKYPEGIDATTGSQISGGFTITSAQELAQELQSGALPIKLQLISRTPRPTR
jgi:SecD/SecF fusion protein